MPHNPIPPINEVDSTFVDKKVTVSFPGAVFKTATEVFRKFSEILWSKGIWHNLEIWGSEIHHDWPTWRRMLPYILSTKF